MKKVILGLILFVCAFGFFTQAGVIEFSPSEGSFGKGCTFGVDINIDTEGASIAAFDLIMESSMEFFDFVPGKMFPYYFPPVVKGSTISLLGFGTDPNNWINGKGTLGKIYFKSKPGDTDGAIKIYFAGKGDTTDSNLSIPGGVDTLTLVKDAYYTFSSDGECIDETKIVGGYHGISYESGLNLVVNKIDSDYKKLKMTIFLERAGLIGISIIILLLVLRYLHKKGYLVRHKLKTSNT